MQSAQIYRPAPELQFIYDTAPVGLAFLTPDCRYVQINQRLTEICGISVADHIGRSVRETVPQVADDVEKIVQAVVRTGEPVMGIEVRGQRADKTNADHVWTTNWHPLKSADGSVVGVNVVAEDITERKRAEPVLRASEKALRESESRFRELADNISQFAWTADPSGSRYWYNKRWHDYAGTALEEDAGLGMAEVAPSRSSRSCGPAPSTTLRSGHTLGGHIPPARPRRRLSLVPVARVANPQRNRRDRPLAGHRSGRHGADRRRKGAARKRGRFRELADNISQFAWTADHPGWSYWYNKRWHDFTGTTLEEMQGWGWQKLHHPDHVERVVANHSEKLRQPARRGKTRFRCAAATATIAGS